LGFRELPGYDKPTYNGLVGPIFIKPEEDGGILYGFRAEPRHCNAQDAVHGGMLAGFADIVLTGGTNYLARLSRFVVTISLTTDFLSPAKLGSWVQTRPEVLKVGRGTAFSQCLVTADGKPVLRCSGTFHLGGEPDPKYDRIRQFLGG
jgi:uncharacterized protein (TIGR00369 family)